MVEYFSRPFGCSVSPSSASALHATTKVVALRVRLTLRSIGQLHGATARVFLGDPLDGLAVEGSDADCHSKVVAVSTRLEMFFFPDSWMGLLLFLFLTAHFRGLQPYGWPCYRDNERETCGGDTERFVSPGHLVSPSRAPALRATPKVVAPDLSTQTRTAAGRLSLGARFGRCCHLCSLRTCRLPRHAGNILSVPLPRSTSPPRGAVPGHVACPARGTRLLLPSA